ncbi:CoxG family protein [Mesobacterium pallidum]|uniref:CoxG family protein n=1 Tax=Mesobacterium pallidum TaxID=2872037 RepID=UPI001EE19712|nr:carbon monoxide dehydrogenase subunit G [Mesobacterium pallidum]
MELKGSRSIAAPREVVYAAMLDPDVLKACVPGCQEMTGNADDGFEAVVVQKVGPVKATFKGKVAIEDPNPPASLKIVGEGKGGAAGFASGGAVVTLTEEGEGTLLEYDVQAKVGGKLAQLGSRIIDGFAKKMADQFFERFQGVVEGPEEGETDPEVAEVAAEKKGWLKRLARG